MERDYHSPLYEDVLLPSLQRISKSLPMDALTEAIYKLKNFETGTLLQKNMVFMDYLQNLSLIHICCWFSVLGDTWAKVSPDSVRRVAGA